MPARIIYMGTPEFAVPALETLANRTDVEIPLVVTQPDRPAGRGKRMTSPAVKVAADSLELPVLQTPTLRDDAVKQLIRDHSPDLVVVAAFGMILGKWILELPSLGSVNLHASLLPKYRGANPIASAIACGETESGVTLMKMDRGLDTGPMLARVSRPIEQIDTTESLTPKLAADAADLLDRELSAMLAGELTPVDQPDAATLTRQMTKADGDIDWSRSASELDRHVRAMWPWPRAWTTLPSKDVLQVHRATPVDVAGESSLIHHDGHTVLVGTGEGSLRLDRVQLPGGKPIEGDALANHPALAAGICLASSSSDRPPLVTAVAL